MTQPAAGLAEADIGPSPASSAKPRRRRLFFVGAAIFFLLIVFLGFAPTFYLEPIFHATPAPDRNGNIPAVPLYLYVHGAVMTVWYALFLVQSTLIARRHVEFHRRLGVAGAVLTVAVVSMGAFTTLGLPHHIRSAYGLDAGEMAQYVAQHGTSFVVVLDLLTLGLVSLFVTVAILQRRRPEIHGRLMFLSFLATIGPALSTGRTFGAAVASVLHVGFFLGFVVTALVLAGLAMHDLRTRRRVHPVTVVGALCLVVLPLLISPLIDTAAVRAWLVSLS
jgi:hypothetical protein